MYLTYSLLAGSSNENHLCQGPIDRFSALLVFNDVGVFGVSDVLDVFNVFNVSDVFGVFNSRSATDALQCLPTIKEYIHVILIDENKVQKLTGAKKKKVESTDNNYSNSPKGRALSAIKTTSGDMLHISFYIENKRCFIILAGYELLQEILL